MVPDHNELREAIIGGHLDRIDELVRQQLDAGVAPAEIINQGLLPGMEVVGHSFRAGDMFIPEVMRSAKTMNQAMAILEPLVVGQQMATQGKVLIGTVDGDLHNIGKDLVSMLMKSAGFEVIDLGINVAASSFVQAVRDHQPDVVGLSALLTTTMPAMKATIDALRSNGLLDSCKVIVGGAPVNQQFADEIGAHAYAADAGAALEVTKELVA
jgi:5-methyltetrahydrofolate--homocysteine methyltransferase